MFKNCARSYALRRRGCFFRNCTAKFVDNSDFPMVVALLIWTRQFSARRSSIWCLLSPHIFITNKRAAELLSTLLHYNNQKNHLSYARFPSYTQSAYLCVGGVNRSKNNNNNITAFLSWICAENFSMSAHTHKKTLDLRWFYCVKKIIIAIVAGVVFYCDKKKLCLF